MNRRQNNTYEHQCKALHRGPNPLQAPQQPLGLLRFAQRKGLSDICSMMAKRSTIEEALDGRQVFLTGATGMLGTALVSKLINDTTVSTLYVLVRGGHGTHDSPTFYNLRHPDAA